jgi:malonyl-CoA O-methyltransferase
MDPQAAAQWSRRRLKVLVSGPSPWLHEEVGRRMQERLDVIKLQPQHWLAWEPLRSGLEYIGLIQARYAQAQCHVYARQLLEREQATAKLQKPWWQPARWLNPIQVHDGVPAKQDMLWANMVLHTSADPQAMMSQWHQALEVDGFVMFSCLGPDTLRELRALYAAQGWTPPAHEFTDMHDWGDMLVQAGFAEPVMDMERITLTFETPERLLLELRELGRNLSLHRHSGLKGRQWHAQLLQALQQLARPEDDGRLVLTFEVIYGHALKPQARAKVQALSEIGLEDMRAMLRQSRPE